MVTQTLMRSGQVARRAGLSHTRFLQLAERGEIPIAARTDDGWRLFRPEDAEAFIARRSTTPPRRNHGPPVPAA